MWIKLGILITGFFYAGFLPHSLRKTLRHTDIDLNKLTLSYLSNKRLFGKEYLKGYKRLLFAMAVSILVFFLLLIEYYELHMNETLLRYVDFSTLFLVCLAFLPHNIQPFTIRHHLGRSLQRVLHNLMAVLVFITIPGLALTFQIDMLDNFPALAISGIAVVGVVVIATLWSIIAHGLNGVSELLFINGISVWAILVTIFTVLI